MERTELIAAINKTFVETLEVPEEDLKPEAQIFADLGLDSLDMVDLMIGLQRRFGISLRQSEEMRQIVTLNDLYDFFEKLEKQEKAQGVDTDSKIKEIMNQDK
ncbi:MAG: acyl carrier protein [Lentisphaeria bacterium]|nr:acyl carrier protein [Lentisphaeria bacterium]